MPEPKFDRDAQIAATAMVHRMTVVTRNVADFAATWAPVLDPWNPVPERALGAPSSRPQRALSVAT